MLSGLDSISWYRIVYSARRCRNLGRAGSVRREAFDVNLLPEDINKRVAAVLIERAEPEVAHQIFGRSLWELSLDDAVIREFANREALDLKRLGTNDWKPDLAMIQECYRRGGDNYGPFFPRGMFLRADRTFPLEIARTIANSPTSFPNFLVASAEESLRIEVTGKATPVAEIALTQGWFS
jgi:hypothetical protein